MHDNTIMRTDEDAAAGRFHGKRKVRRMQDGLGGKDAAWLKATQEQIRDLEQIRRMVSRSLRRLRRKMREQKGIEGQEACIAEMARLTQLQVKLIPLEQDLRRRMEEARRDGKAPSQALDEEDWQLLEDALKRRQRVAEDEGSPASGE